MEADAAWSLFRLVCGQHPEHTWMPDGVSLPVCQRCTGLYGGMAWAMGLRWILHPKETTAWGWWHGLLLAQMLPFGLHWVPQEALIRTTTGYLFGLGLVGLLWPWGEEKNSTPMPMPRAFTALTLYIIGGVVGLALTLGLAACGGAGAGKLLTFATWTGLAGMAWLVTWQLARLVRLAAQWFGRRRA